MKQTLLFFLFVFYLLETKASDTLTVRQVFNFNVGDTFDYSYVVDAQIPRWVDHPVYTRYVIQSKNISTAGDSITYVRRRVYPTLAYDTLVYTLLDSNVIAYDTSSSGSHVDQSCGNLQFIIDTSLGNRIYNQTNWACFEHWFQNRYQIGLGLSIAISGNGDPTYNPPVETDTTTLIYFADSLTSIGTPYYIANGQAYVHFTPVPEQCAVWTRQVDHDAPLWGSYYEQIRTDSIVPFNNHNYVGLLFRSADSYYNTFTPDSFIGYFRNDSIGKKVWFTTSLGSPEAILYNFNLMDDSVIDGSYVSLSEDTLDGYIRTVWSYTYVVYNSNPNDFPDDTVIVRSYEEGIGGLQGFIKIHKPLHSDTIFIGNSVLATNVKFDEGNLVSLCVCGNTIYPDTPMVSCQLLTGINNTMNQLSIIIYPNPTTDQIHLSISNVSQYNAQLALVDLLGKIVYSSPITQSETTHDISKLASGIYTWRVAFDNTIIKTGKVVKQ